LKSLRRECGSSARKSPSCRARRHAVSSLPKCIIQSNSWCQLFRVLVARGLPKAYYKNMYSAHGDEYPYKDYLHETKFSCRATSYDAVRHDPNFVVRHTANGALGFYIVALTHQRCFGDIVVGRYVAVLLISLL
jgi:hypothetical protein